MQKTLYKTGFIAYALLLVMATLFYKERTIFMDAAYHLFHILMSKDFAIQHGRFGAVVTEVFPVVGSKLGLSLKNIMILYSSGTMFFYFLCYVVCGSLLKQYRHALIVLFFSILFATETFYWPFSELQQGCCMLIVMFAILSAEIQAVLKYALILVLMVTLAFIHPLIIVPASFLFIYLLLSGTVNTSKKELLIGFGLFLVIYCIKAKFFVPPYEVNATTGFRQKIKNLVPRYFDLYSVKKFVKDCLGKFIWIPVFTVTTIAYYIVKKKWILLAFYLLSIVGFVSLINISYDYKDVPSFYIENLYLPLAIMLAAPLIFEIIGDVNRKAIILPMFLLVVLSGSYRIYRQHDFFAARLNWFRGFYTENGSKKLIIDQSRVPMPTLIMHWGTPYEFWALSTLEQGKTASIIVTDNVDAMIPPPGKTTSFITTYGGFPYHSFPKEYFKFTDTISEYQVLRKAQ